MVDSSAHQPLADFVHDWLLNALLEGELSPNQSLNIPSIAARLQVSQTPVREALARVEHTGLVRRAVHRGYTVAPMLSSSDVSLLLDARLLLEPEFARLATRHRTPTFVANLEVVVERLEALIGKADHETFHVYWRSDDDFHSTIAKQAGNPFLLSAYESIGAQVQRFRIVARRRAFEPFNYSAAVEHRKVLNAIVAGDESEAARLMAAHLTAARARLVD